MSKKFSPTSISSKLSQGRKQISSSKADQRQQLKSSSKSSNKSSDKSSVKSSSSSSDQNQITQQQVMEQAIQKASCLIELLTRQNSQFKLIIEDLNQQLQKFKSHLRQSQKSNNQLQERLSLSESQNERLIQQNEEILFQLQRTKLYQNDQNSTKQKLQEARTKNKKLHQKIAFISKTSIDLNRELQQIKKQYKSLQNQNQYLLNELKKSQFKENTFSENITVKQSLFQRKLNEIETTKEAFARRTHQLKQQNIELFMEVQNLRKQKYDLEIISRQSMQTLDAITIKLESYRHFEERIHRIYQKMKLIIDQSSSQQYFGAQTTLRQKLEQIQVLITYRLQHIQSLMRQICDKVDKSDWKHNLRELNSTQVLAQRLATYLSELSKAPLKVA